VTKAIPETASETQGPAPTVLHRGSALEVMRWPLTERVNILLDTEALYIERGALLAMIRGGERELALPLLEITEVIFADDGQSVTFRVSPDREVTLNGDEAVRIGAMLWALGVPGRPTPATKDELVSDSGVRINQPVDATGTLVVGPLGIAFAPSGLFRQLVGGEALRIEGPSVGGAWLDPKDKNTLAVQHGNATHRFRVPEAAALLQALRQTMSRGEEERAGEAGRLPIELAREHFDARANDEPELPDPGDILLSARGIWTQDERSAIRVTIILGSEHVLLLPDAPASASWHMKTGRIRRGDGPDDPVDSPLLRLSGRANTTIVRPVGGSAVVRQFWRSAAPHQYVIPGEDYDPEPWRGVVGPARFLRLTPEDLSEHVYRPALLIQRDDGVGVVLPPGAEWPWSQGEFLRAEVSRPRGVFRFAAQFLREDPTAEIPREAVAHLGTDRDAEFRTMVLMPGPLPPTLLPPKRALLRLPTDEPVRVVVRSIADETADHTPIRGTEFKGRLADLSASGCAIQLSQSIPPGSEVVVIPGGQDRYVFRAEVMGTRVMPEAVRLAPRLEFEMGMRFMGLNEARLSWLQREVLRRQRKRLASRAAASDEVDEDSLPMLDRHYHA
jgi:hypothetical protein